MKERIKLIKKILKEEVDKKIFTLNSSTEAVFNGDINKILDFLNKKNYDKIDIKKSLIIFNDKLTKLPDNLNISGGLTLNTNNLTELPKNLTVNGTYIDARYSKILDLPKDIKFNGTFYPSIEVSSEKRRKNKEWDISNVIKGSLGERANALYRYITKTFDENDFTGINNFDLYDIIPLPFSHGKMICFEIPKLDSSNWAVGTEYETRTTAIEFISDNINEGHRFNLEIIKPFLNRKKMLKDMIEYIKDDVYDNPESWGLDPNDADIDGEYNEEQISERINTFTEIAKEDVIKFFIEHFSERGLQEYLNVLDLASDIIDRDGFDSLDSYYDNIGEIYGYYIARIG